MVYFAIAIVQVCPEGELRTSIQSILNPVILLFGLRQRWNLFSPDIRHMNQFSTCVITYDDGAQKLYEWPHNRNFSAGEKFKTIQLRRFIADCWELPMYSFFRPFGSRFMARSHWNPDNPPRFIELVFNGTDIPGFEGFVNQNRIELIPINSRQVTCIYETRPSDFRDLK